MDQDMNQNVEETKNNTSSKNYNDDLKWDDDGRHFAKMLGIGLLIFLGAYCAFYTVADWHMKHIFNPFGNISADINRAIVTDMRQMDKFISNENQKVAHVIHLEESDNEYKIMIDLRAFDNNKNNIQVKHNGNLLTIKGRSITKRHHNQQISEFQQSYMFENNVNLREMTKEVEGNYMVIKIPVKNKD